MPKVVAKDRKLKTMAFNMDLKCIQNDLNSFHSMLKRFNLSEEELNQLIDEIFDENNSKTKSFATNSDKSQNCLKVFNYLLNILCKLLKICLTLLKVLIICLLIITFLSTHCPTQRLILRNSQQLIYPVMRQLRLWTLPLIRYNQHMIGWDVEECIIENPLYGSVGLECWPCDRLNKAPDLSSVLDLAKQYVNNEKPFVFKDVINSTITAETLVNTYERNRESLEFGTAKLVSNCGPEVINSLKDLMLLLTESIKTNNKSNENVFHWKQDIHIEWKLNRVDAIRVIRKLFVRPPFVPNTSEVALQRYIFMDGPHSGHYYLPKTEFANVWLTQASGYRLIVLEPSAMCALNCSTFSVVLRPKDTLYYNWQFYRPRSLPAHIPDSEQLSITFVASFY